MKTLGKTLFEAFVLVVIGGAVALSANQLRGSGSLDLTKSYFDFSLSAEQMEKLRPKAVLPDAAVDRHPADDLAEAKGTNGQHEPKHQFQILTYQQVEEIFSETETAEGLNVFVDARRDELFNEGHIPGAVQCDPYRVTDYVDGLMERINGAKRVIIYCGGGDCVDSILLCKELVVNYDTPLDKVFLFEGGWKEWTSNGMIAETGDTEGNE